MEYTGIRELKTHISKILREVRDRHQRYIITYRGKPVAAIVPIEEPQPELGEPYKENATWDELVRLGKEIGDGWQSPQTSTEILAEMRR